MQQPACSGLFFSQILFLLYTAFPALPETIYFSQVNVFILQLLKAFLPLSIYIKQGLIFSKVTSPQWGGQGPV